MTNLTQERRQQKINSIEEQILQLTNRKKQEMQRLKADERKLRTKRLIERGAILESFIPEADVYSNEQIKAFLTKTIKSDFATKALAGLKLQTGNDEHKSQRPQTNKAINNNSNTSSNTATAQPIKQSRGEGQRV